MDARGGIVWSAFYRLPGRSSTGSPSAAFILLWHYCTTTRLMNYYSRQRHHQRPLLFVIVPLVSPLKSLLFYTGKRRRIAGVVQVIKAKSRKKLRNLVGHNLWSSRLGLVTGPEYSRVVIAVVGGDVALNLNQVPWQIAISGSVANGLWFMAYN